MKTLNRITLLIASIPAVLSVGCGRVLPSNINYAPANSTIPASAPSAANKTAASFNCPSAPNVLPNLDETVDGADYFTVCTSKTVSNFSDLLITGNFGATHSLCVVPVHMQNGGKFAPELDTQSNAIYSCSAPTAAGVLVTVPTGNSSAFNAVIIVESPDLNSLITCLAYNSTNCPNYSFGRIR